MGFDDVYKALEQVFPHVDKRILRAVAIEHSDDLNTALDYIFTEALPYVSTKSVSSVTPQENQQPLGKTNERAVKVLFKPLKENGPPTIPYVSTKSVSFVTPQENQQPIGKTDERAVKVLFKPLKKNEPPTTSMTTSRTREQQSMTLKHHVVVENTDVGSSSTSGLLLFQNGNHVDQSSVMLDQSEKSVFEEALNTPVLSDKDDDNMLDFSDTETSLIRSSEKRKDAKVNGGPIFTSSMVENTDVGSSSTSGLLLFQNGNHVDQSSVMLDHSEKSVFEDCFPKPSPLSSPLQPTSSISIINTVNGLHELKITGFSLSKGMGVGKYIASDTFMVGGYAWAIYFYPGGKRSEDNEAYVSLFIVLVSEGTDVRALFELTLLDQSGNERHRTHTHFGKELEPCKLKRRGSMWGYKRLFRRTRLESSDYLKDDCLSIQCRVGVIRSKEPSDTESSLIRSPKVNGGPSSMVSLASMQASDVGVCGSPSLEQEGQNGYESDQDTLACAQISYKETSLNSVPLEVDHSSAQLVVTSDDHEADQDTLACAHNEDSSLDNTPLEIALSVVERALCSDQENLQDNDALDYSVTSLNDYGVVVAHCEKPEATYSLDLNVSQANSVGDLRDDEEESLLNTSLTRSQEICSVDFLEEIIEDAKNNKKTLFNAMESVIDTMREVEQREKEAEEAKEEAARAGEDILSQSEDLKKILQHAKDRNDTHAGEVYGEKSILATEARELQSRLLCLSGERDKSLAILHELNISLQARLALADEEIASAEMEKLDKEQAAEERHTEQKIIMEKVVEESKILQQEAEENSKLREFLVDRGRVVDVLQGEISVICQDVRLLKERFDERVPLSKSVSSSQTTCKLASSSSSLKSVASVHALEQFQFSESPKKAASVDGESQKSNPVHPPAYNSNSWDDGWDLLENDD